jgi:hypothetical protein
LLVPNGDAHAYLRSTFGRAHTVGVSLGSATSTPVFLQTLQRTCIRTCRRIWPIPLGGGVNCPSRQQLRGHRRFVAASGAMCLPVPRTVTVQFRFWRAYECLGPCWGYCLAMDCVMRHADSNERYEVHLDRSLVCSVTGFWRDALGAVPHLGEACVPLSVLSAYGCGSGWLPCWSVRGVREHQRGQPESTAGSCSNRLL